MFDVGMFLKFISFNVYLSAQPGNEDDHPPADNFLPSERVFSITAVLLLTHRRHVESGLSNKSSLACMSLHIRRSLCVFNSSVVNPGNTDLLQKGLLWLGHKLF